MPRGAGSDATTVGALQNFVVGFAAGVIRLDLLPTVQADGMGKLREPIQSSCRTLLLNSRA